MAKKRRAKVLAWLFGLYGLAMVGKLAVMAATGSHVYMRGLAIACLVTVGAVVGGVLGFRRGLRLGTGGHEGSPVTGSRS
ncbi:hypothetical protein ACIPJS_33880 [Streptomyces sp. NPDC086783]|uniref:hypothetical protein n=1 Tax=Streptomyces sp. NPDC086783 TaxID=3365758 RepID=UPI0038159B87